MAKSAIDYTKCNVLILGSMNLQNEFLHYVINREIGAACSIYDQDINPFPENIDTNILELNKKTTMILIDSADQSFEKILKDIITNPHLSKCIIALFNLREKAGVEKKALSRQIRGFFYKNDHFEVFLKGIRLILNGEVWISRELLLQYVLDSFEDKKATIQEKTTLTQREMEILALVSIGSTNDEIAEKMFISSNTVKTHLYNIFKKINVPNRLQAALWAVKNL
ncbi:MAG: response regulator transcription factor [Spirochaetes bacterium]|nr:response regulator transcription factor [Spirochaetota bacterium]